MHLRQGAIPPARLPDELHGAARQLASAITAGAFAGLPNDRVLELRGLSLFLCEAEDTARDLLALSRGGGR